MIKKVSEILEAFIKKEKNELEKVKMGHMPTLGEAYEDLLERGISDYAIPSGLNLKIVSGFIKIRGKMVQKQIDCMLVRGDGDKYGKKFIYDRSDVLIIFEVKRKLNSQSLYKGWKHLSDITRKCTEDFCQKVDFEEYEPDITVVGHYFGALLKKMPPKKYKEIFDYDKKDGIVFFSFLQDSDLPLRILHTFEGYANEINFRKAYLDVFEKFYNGSESWRVALPNIPNLVTTGNYAVIKGTGQPHFVRNEDALLAAVSIEGNIAEVLIETIWMKISRFVGVVMPWGEDQQLEKVSPLVKCWPREEGERAGWEYYLFHESFVIEDSTVMWEPEVLTDFVDSFIILLYMYEGVSTNDGSFLNICNEYGLSKEAGINEVMKTDLFAISDDAIYPVYNKFYMGYAANNEEKYITNDKERLEGWMKINDKKLGIVNFIRV